MNNQDAIELLIKEFLNKFNKDADGYKLLKSALDLAVKALSIGTAYCETKDENIKQKEFVPIDNILRYEETDYKPKVYLGRYYCNWAKAYKLYKELIDMCPVCLYRDKMCANSQLIPDTKNSEDYKDLQDTIYPNINEIERTVRHLLSTGKSFYIYIKGTYTSEYVKHRINKEGDIFYKCILTGHWLRSSYTISNIINGHLKIILKS